MPQRKRKLTESVEPEYRNFIRGLKLITLALNSCTCTLDREKYFQLLRSKPGAVRDVTANYALDDAGKDYFTSKAAFRLVVSGRNGETAFSLDCAFEAHFHVPETLNKAFAEQFTSSEVRLVLWPYFRQFVFDMTARMTIPPITIPLSTESQG